MGLSILLTPQPRSCDDSENEPYHFRRPALPKLCTPMIAKVAQAGCASLCLVFRSGEQYVFAVGDSTKTFTVRLSSAAIGLFKSHGIGADDLARIAARWALGRGMKTVTLELTSEEFTDLYLSVYPYLDEGLSRAA
jgi:hypothetical protein